MNPWLAVASSLLSGLVAVIISTWSFRRYESRRMKLELVRRLAGTRYQLAGVIGDAKEFFSALNEAFVVFYDCPKVLQAIDQLKQRLHEPDSLDETIPALFRVLLDSLGMRSTEVSDEFIMHPFTLNPTAKRSQIGTVKGKQAEPVRPDNVG